MKLSYSHRQIFKTKVIIYLVAKIVIFGIVFLAIHGLVGAWLISLPTAMVFYAVVQRILTYRTTDRAFRAWNYFYSKYGYASSEIKEKEKGLGVIDDCAFRMSAVVSERGVYFDNDWAKDSRKFDSHVSAFVPWEKICEIKVADLEQYKNTIIAQIKLRDCADLKFVIPWSEKFHRHIPPSVVTKIDLRGPA